MSSSAQNQAKEALSCAYEISQLLDTGLDKRTLATIMGLCENGVNPEALAYAVKELRRSVQEIRETEQLQGNEHRRRQE